MATNKENLHKLLEFLDKSILHEPENKWFVEELRKRIGRLPNNNDVSISSVKLNEIEHYLGIDYKIDSEFSPIDYSFLDDNLQRIAESDHREMLRYKLGLRGHKKNFAEYCRYVQYQAELLLNYYYDRFYQKDIEKIINAIEHYNKYYTPPTNPDYRPKKVEDIGFKHKLWAFYKQYEFEGVGDLDNVINVRNALSHRSAKANKGEIEYLRTILEKDGAIFNGDGRMSKKNTPKLVYDSEDAKKYRLEFFLLESPYNRTERALCSLIDKIYDNV